MTGDGATPLPVTLEAFQRQIETLYGDRDRARGLERTFLWFVEEVGELARALKRGDDRENLEVEFSDVLAWLTTLASLADVEMGAVAGRYLPGCPRCGERPCACPPR